MNILLCISKSIYIYQRISCRYTYIMIIPTPLPRKTGDGGGGKEAKRSLRSGWMGTESGIVSSTRPVGGVFERGGSFRWLLAQPVPSADTPGCSCCHHTVQSEPFVQSQPYAKHLGSLFCAKLITLR